MAKGGFLTPKAIANRIKSKGLQKLRWYCDMCQKQCRDENGFKCHQTSEGHLRQMKIFRENSAEIQDLFSNQFEEGYVQLLSRRFGEKRVKANEVYNEYIKDRTHIHMKSTMWQTLTGFIKYLGKKGICVVDETEKGWFVQWIRRDAAALARDAALEKMNKSRLDYEEREKRRINKAVAKAKLDADAKGISLEVAPSELDRNSSIGSKIEIGFSKKDAIPMKHKTEKHSSRDEKKFSFSKAIETKSSINSQKSIARSGVGYSSTTNSINKKRQQPITSLSAVMNETKRRRLLEDEKLATEKSEKNKREEEELIQLLDKRNRFDHWLQEGIVVKVMNKILKGGKFYKLKAVVHKVIDKYTAEIKLLESGKKLRIDQDELETVIPKVGGLVTVLQGAFRGDSAVLTKINKESFNVNFKMKSGDYIGRMVESVEYEDVCKLNTIV